MHSICSHLLFTLHPYTFMHTQTRVLHAHTPINNIPLRPCIGFSTSRSTLLSFAIILHNADLSMIHARTCRWRTMPYPACRAVNPLRAVWAGANVLSLSHASFAQRRGVYCSVFRVIWFNVFLFFVYCLLALRPNFLTVLLWSKSKYLIFYYIWIINKYCFYQYVISYRLCFFNQHLQFLSNIWTCHHFHVRYSNI